MQQGLAHWHAFLSKKSLPILTRTKKDVQALIDQTHLSITQYTTPIFYDACFSALIFQHVNGARQASNKNPLTTLGNALSHMGQMSFQNFLNKSLLLETLKLSDKNYQGFIRVMGQSCHASLQSREWALQRSVAETEEIQLAALLQNVAELMLWCYADDAMPKIEEQCYINKKTYEQATNEILGCGMRELGARLSETWNLPEMATNGLVTRQDDFTLATGVSLASDLARIVTRTWYGKEAVDVISHIAKYKGKSEGEIERRLHIAAVNVNDVLIDKGFSAPAKLLFQLADDDYKDPQFVLEKIAPIKNINNDMQAKIAKDDKIAKNISSKDKLTAIEKIKSFDARRNILEKIKAQKLSANLAKDTQVKPVHDDIKKISNKNENNDDKNISKISNELTASIEKFDLLVAENKSAHDLISFVVNVFLLCGVQRCVFLIKIKNKDMLVAKYSAESMRDILINDFKITLNKPHIFKRLLEKNSSIFISDENYGKYCGLVPENIKMSIGVKRFFISSIFLNDRAIGLVYADKVKGKLTQAEFTQFKGVCRLLSKGLAKSLKKNSDSKAS